MVNWMDIGGLPGYPWGSTGSQSSQRAEGCFSLALFTSDGLNIIFQRSGTSTLSKAWQKIILFFMHCALCLVNTAILNKLYRRPH